MPYSAIKKQIDKPKIIRLKLMHTCKLYRLVRVFQGCIFGVVLGKGKGYTQLCFILLVLKS